MTFVTSRAIWMHSTECVYIEIIIIFGSLHKYNCYHWCTGGRSIAKQNLRKIFLDNLPWGVPPGELLNISPGDDMGGTETGVPGLLLPGPKSDR